VTLEPYHPLSAKSTRSVQTLRPHPGPRGAEVDRRGGGERSERSSRREGPRESGERLRQIKPCPVLDATAARPLEGVALPSEGRGSPPCAWCGGEIPPARARRAGPRARYCCDSCERKAAAERLCFVRRALRLAGYPRRIRCVGDGCEATLLVESGQGWRRAFCCRCLARRKLAARYLAKRESR
jgi:hypothetical protein